MKSTEDESGIAVVNEHETSTADEVPVSTTDFHVDHSDITTIEEGCTEPDSASEQGVIMSTLTASAHASINPMAVASSDQLAPNILSMSSVQTTEEDISDSSAGQVPKGCAKDVVKLGDPLQEKDTVEKEGECEEPDIRTQHDDEDHCGASPSISTLLSQSDGNNHGTAEGSQCLLEMHNNSTELEKERTTVQAAAILASTSLTAVSDQFDSPSGKEDGKIIFSDETPNMDEFLVSKNISAKATHDASFEYVPQSSDGENIRVAIGDVEPLSVPGGNLVERAREDLDSPHVQAASGKGTDKIVEFSKHLQGATNSISKITKDTENEYGIVPDTAANVAVPACKPAQEISDKKEYLEDQKSKVALRKDFDRKAVSTSIRMRDESFQNYVEDKVELGVGSGLSDADHQAVRETNNLAMSHLKQNVHKEECSVSTSRDSAADAEKAVDKSEDTWEDTVKDRSENNQAELIASNPQSCDSLPSNCILEPDVALSSPVPLSGSKSAEDERRENKESDNEVSHATCSDDAAPGVVETPSHSLSDQGCKSDIPETTLHPVPTHVAFESESAGDGKEQVEMVQPVEYPTPDGDVNGMSDLPEDTPCGEVEVTDEHENGEVSILATEVSGPIQESCELGGGEDAIHDEITGRIGNEYTELHPDEHAEANPASDVPILTTEVSHSAEDAAAPDITSDRVEDQSSAIESGEPGTDKNANVDNVKVDQSSEVKPATESGQHANADVELDCDDTKSKSAEGTPSLQSGQ
ncbi:uncharacterized protein LOC131013916 isoform X2 [Salvia miltiorrhiza]|uniref:uncharacterized protein LOC131013916 isoform X2 n=1 Tax=Salvia miltiorrhiza TaxID=226208 RepID=UPI0025AC2F47|nr:uncharacterized protein LOC131013916 isoform X2 [Salvia miltiorrhiza]XP_057797824.1 uncharacterized protein LOC131013916 isoform X2 [Salvia miltiorrhiza]